MSIPNPHPGSPAHHPSAYVDFARDESGRPRPGLLVAYAVDGRVVATAALIAGRHGQWLVVAEGASVDDAEVVADEHHARLALMKLAEDASRGGAR